MVCPLWQNVTGVCPCVVVVVALGFGLLVVVVALGFGLLVGFLVVVSLLGSVVCWTGLGLGFGDSLPPAKARPVPPTMRTAAAAVMANDLVMVMGSLWLVVIG
jgi:hypothetical protein